MTISRVSNIEVGTLSLIITGFYQLHDEERSVALCVSKYVTHHKEATTSPMHVHDFSTVRNLPTHVYASCEESAKLNRLNVKRIVTGKVKRSIHQVFSH